MNATSPFARKLAAVLAAGAATLVFAGVAFAHPAAEGDHPGGCIVTAEPGTVASGAKFTVAGNFGGASVYVVPGADGNVPENADPDATTPPGSSFSVELTAGDPGTYRVWGFIEGSECGDSDSLVVTAPLPDTAAEPPTASIGSIVLMALLLIAFPATLAARRLLRAR
jgi:hypothetical protein